MAYNPQFLKEAIALSIQNIEEGGGPFGALIVKDNKVIATGVNRVTVNHDPTAHAEMQAIRKAAALLSDFDLAGCEIYSSCEPCPMCLGAIYWAHLDALYFANSKADAKAIGFDDSFIYEEINLKMEDRRVKTEQHLSEEAIAAFKMWESKEDRIEY